MNDIRKIAVGPDYKGGAMHYVVGQEILGGSHLIHLIRMNNNQSIGIFIENKKGEIYLWKEFTSYMPISIEYNIYFE
tara:strand:+ start:168 stop:398 length:231 start_codon:yes stop_codon:yes gene_type:complete